MRDRIWKEGELRERIGGKELCAISFHNSHPHTSASFIGSLSVITENVQVVTTLTTCVLLPLLAGLG